MGIEAIGNAISGATSTIGGVVGSVGRGIESGPSMRSVIVNEGPVGPSFLENTMPYTLDKFNPTGEILFNPIQEGPLEPLSVSDLIAEAQSVISQAQVNPLTGPEIATEVNHWPGAAYWFTDVIMPQAEPKPATIVEHFGNVVEEAEAVAARAWENNVLTQAENVVETAVFAQPVSQEQEVEEIVREEIVVERGKEVIEEEKVVKKKKHLVDYPVLAQVLFEVKEAYEKGAKEARRLGKKLFGPMLAGLLPGQHEGNTGGAVKPDGVDGTISARREAIAEIKEINSLDEVKPAVYAIRPVTIGEDGEPATQEEVDTTYQDYIVKPSSVTEVVEKRIKKKALVSGGQAAMPFTASEETRNKSEPTLKELNPILAEVFQKAA